jgi:hypothetical protein
MRALLTGLLLTALAPCAWATELADLQARALELVRAQLDEVPDVEVRALGREELRAVLFASVAPQYGVQLEDAGEARAAANAFARAAETMTLATYAPEERVTLVCEENVDELARRLGLEPAERDALLGAVLVHEAVHAADHAVHDWPAVLAGLGTGPEIEAYDAVLEGHAQHVARAACAGTDWEEGFLRATAEIGRVPERRPDDAGLDFARRRIATANLARYLDGERFVRALAERGGDEAVTRALTEPPPDLETLLHPDWFLDPASRPTHTYDLERALGTRYREIDARDWSVQLVEIGVESLTATLEGIGRESIDRVLRGFLQAHGVAARMRRGARTGIEMQAWSLFEFETGSDAAAYVEAARDLGRVREEQIAKRGITIVERIDEPVLGDGWRGFYSERVILTGETRARIQTLVASRGTLAAEVYLSGVPTERGKLLRETEKMFRRALTLGRTAGAGDGRGEREGS